jgi:hypothetical protein
MDTYHGLGDEGVDHIIHRIDVGIETLLEAQYRLLIEDPLGSGRDYLLVDREAKDTIQIFLRYFRAK